MSDPPVCCPHTDRPHSGRPCGLCRRASTLALVVAAEPSLTAVQTTDAFDAAITTGAALRSLTAALAAGPDVLASGAPPVVGRLVAELIAAGSTTYTVPACVVCDRTGRGLHTTSGGAMCQRCAHHRGAAACSRCEQVKPVAGRTSDGAAICERCRRRQRGQRCCGICGVTAAIALRARDGRPDVCVGCYRLPDATCHRCQRRRPCTFAASDQPVCQACAPRATAVCANCGADRPPTARWPDGPVCEPCYRAALRRRGVCAGCGATRRLLDPPGADATHCADCAGVALPGGHVCGGCGIEDRLFERGRCVRCALARRTHQLLAGDGGDVPVALVAIRDAIVAARQPYTAINWLRSGAAAQILADLAAGRLAISHDALDGHPRPAAADYLRRMLTAHGVLDDRNETLARTERWVAELLADIDRPADRRLVATYATWRVIRRLRHRAEHTSGPWTATRHTHVALRAAVDLLDWLAARSVTLADAGQADIDTWLTTSPAAYAARDFLAWTGEHGHSHTLTVAPPGRRTGTTAHPDTRWATLSWLLHDDTVDLTDRVAGCLLLCYAQQLSRITALTVDQITRHDDGHTTIRFGTSDVNVPEPLAGLIGALIDTPRSHVGVGAPTTSRWLIPGLLPGRPLTPARLGARLRKLGIHARAGRRATLLQLAAELPAAVLADMLDLAPGTAVGWVNNAGGDWSRYAAALANQAITQQAE